jgi:hypothetical protein
MNSQYVLNTSSIKRLTYATLTVGRYFYKHLLHGGVWTMNLSSFRLTIMELLEIY